MTIRLQPGPKAGEPGRGEVDDVQPQRIAVLVVDGEAGVEAAALERRGVGQGHEPATREGDPGPHRVLRRGRRARAGDEQPENSSTPKNEAGSVRNHGANPTSTRQSGRFMCRSKALKRGS